MNHRPTTTFVILVVVVAALAYGALVLTGQLRPATKDVTSIGQDVASEAQPERRLRPSRAQAEEIDTSNWKSYVDREHFLSFKYPTNWQLQTYDQQAGYYIIVLRPNTNDDHIRFYVSPDSYFGLTGLPSQKDTLAGVSAVNVNNMLYGVHYAAQYYTFDAGHNSRLLPQFHAILGTVAFSR